MSGGLGISGASFTAGHPAAAERVVRHTGGAAADGASRWISGSQIRTKEPAAHSPENPKTPEPQPAARALIPHPLQDVKYNIPVALWLPERYPVAPPMPYVVPTPDMLIKPRHSFVDASGFVRAPCVVHWSPG